MSLTHTSYKICNTFSIIVFTDAPIITPHRESVVVQVNRQARIPCGQQVLSYPPASFTWLKLTQNSKTTLQFSTVLTDGSLTIASSSYSDSGTYICNAENSVGMTSALVTVLVLGIVVHTMRFNWLM